MSALDRSVPPAPGPAPRVELPAVERERGASGLRIAATRSSVTPELLLELALPSGRVREPLGREGLASLTARMLQEGTLQRSTVELIDAFDFLGAQFDVLADEDQTTLRLRVLEQHAERALELVADVLLTPRWGEPEFARVVELRRAALRSRADDAGAVAHDLWSRSYWGRSTALGSPSIGDAASLAATSLSDLRAFHEGALRTPRAWRCTAVCRGGLEQARAWLAPLEARVGERIERGVAAPGDTWSEPTPLPRGRTRVFVADRPGAPQSELRVGHASVESAHPAWLPLSALNLALGGVFSSRLNLNLRERAGFTYGVRSSFEGGRRAGPFLVSTSVHTAHTVAALTEIERELEGFLSGPTTEELDFVRSSLEQSLARQFESPGARLGYVSAIERLGLADDYPLQRLAWLARTPRDEMARLVAEHLRPAELIIVVVGDLGVIGKELTARYGARGVSAD